MKNPIINRRALAVAFGLALASAMNVPQAVSQPETAESTPAFSWTQGVGASDADKALAEGSVQIKYDGLHVEPKLNLRVNDGDVLVSRDTEMQFHAYWNYAEFIERAEVRVFEIDASIQAEPLLVLPMDGASVSVKPSGSVPDELVYLLRVYGSGGAFDETQPKFLTLVEEPVERIETIQPDRESGYGIDRTAVRNIPVKGGSVTVYGRNLSDQALVSVMGQTVPVDAQGKFVVQTLLPFGDNSVQVDIQDQGQNSFFARDIYIDDTEFFYVAIGEVTLGTQDSSGATNLFADDDDEYVNGRGAMYAKGRVNGDYLVTGSIDTGEERFEDLLRNLDQKDPDQLLRRLDGDRFYPVYGDDSTTVEDAPTQGRFYLKVEKDQSHIMWGNFATQIVSTEFAQLDRGLYGAIADYNSDETTRYGERARQITAFAADPGTTPAREEFLGTGGSLYFLEHQDISIGSERVRVEIRDKVSGLVIETSDLVPQEDYDVDYIQGRILLSDPLSSIAQDSQVVRDSSLSGNDVFLVVRYEYTSTVSEIDGYTMGGRVTQWLYNDNVRLGFTAQNDESGATDQDLYGVDAIIRRSAKTFVKAEWAQTQGPRFGQTTSVDGGFSFDTPDIADPEDDRARAYRFEGSLDLSEFSNMSGQAIAYFDRQDDGFTGANRFVIGRIKRNGLNVTADLSEQTQTTLKYDEVRAEAQGNTRALYADLAHSLNEEFAVSVGVRHDDYETNTGGVVPAIEGTRTDLSAQLDYYHSDAMSLYAFGQGTVDRDDDRAANNRLGFGGDFQLNERLSAVAELSDGNGGFGARTQATFARSDHSEFYLGYALSPDTTETGLATQSQILGETGTLTLGARTRYSDALSVYGEERYGRGRSQTSLTHAYGLNFNPSEIWSFGASIESGEIDSDLVGLFNRDAFSLSAARATDRMRFATNLEARFEDGIDGLTEFDRETWLMRNTASYDASDSWELLARFNIAKSESDQSDFLDADFVEGIVGAAYRPVDNDRWNTLFKYTYFEDLAPVEQISGSGETELPSQRSQIYSVDAIYDLTQRLSIGVKYGKRTGEVALDRTTDDFIKSDADLGILRLDYHVVSQWDLLLEGRVLSTSLADDKLTGFLVGAYRHMGDHVKLGAGYNFSDFSDDLTEFDSDAEGFFINLVGKF